MQFTNLNDINGAEVNEIMVYSFPPSEIPDYEGLKRFAKAENSEVIVCEDEGKVQGFTLCITYRDMVLVFLLAVNKNSRSRGYGSRILAHLKEKYNGKRLFLEMERPIEGKESYPQRIKRNKFYNRNGFKAMNYSYKAYDEDFLMMCCDCNVSYEEYVELLYNVVGKDKTLKYIKPEYLGQIN